jgi:tetratricopeptide (TPR) repeat protein
VRGRGHPQASLLTYLNGWFTLADMYVRRGLADRAAEARRRLEAQVPREDREVGLLVKSLNLSSLRAQYADRPEEARAGLERALRWDPYSPLTLRNLGALAFFRRDVDEALRLLTLSRQIEPGYARTWYNLGHAHRAKGDTENALACYRRYVELEKNPAEQSRVENAQALIQQLATVQR